MTVATALDEKQPAKIAKNGHGGARPNTGGPRPGSGRPKGVPNALNADVKKAIQEAFNQAGGAAYLLGIAQSDPRTFCTLLGKIVPTVVTGDAENPIQHAGTIKFVIVDGSKENAIPGGVKNRGLASDPQE